MSLDRALKRWRRESEALPEDIAGAADWLQPRDDEADDGIPAGLLDRFSSEDAAPDPVAGDDRAVNREGPELEALSEEPEALGLPEEETGAAPDWSRPPDDEDPGIPAGLLDRFTSEDALPEDEAPSDQGGEREPPQATRLFAPPTGASEPVHEPASAKAERRESLGLFNGFNPHEAAKVVSEPLMDHGTAEQYGRLAAVLHHAQVERGIKKVMVTSAVAGEGKTLTALNLALTLSESYQRRVAFIDADLRRSRVHELLNVVRVSGLSEALQDADQRQARLMEVSPRLSVLLAGCSSLDPKGALTSRRMAQILDEAAAIFDWVIVDTPPVVLLPDTNLLARMVDVAIVVVRAGRTSYEVVDRAVQTLDRKRVLGVVLNDAQDSEALQYYYSSRVTP
jgi:capsular exopolysaccharide synthesis family protein